MSSPSPVFSLTLLNFLFSLRPSLCSLDLNVGHILTLSLRFILILRLKSTSITLFSLRHSLRTAVFTPRLVLLQWRTETRLAAALGSELLWE